MLLAFDPKQQCEVTMSRFRGCIDLSISSRRGLGTILGGVEPSSVY